MTGPPRRAQDEGRAGRQQLPISSSARRPADETASRYRAQRRTGGGSAGAVDSDAAIRIDPESSTPGFTPQLAMVLAEVVRRVLDERDVTASKGATA